MDIEEYLFVKSLYEGALLLLAERIANATTQEERNRWQHDMELVTRYKRDLEEAVSEMLRTTP